MLVTRAEAQTMKELDKIEVHDYCCCIYGSEEDWQDAVVPFIKQGLLNGEKCVYQTYLRSEEYVRQCLAANGIDVNSFMASGQLELIPFGAVLELMSAERLDDIIDVYSTAIDKWMLQGYQNIRLCSEIDIGAMHALKLRERYLKMQLRFNRDLYPHYPIKAINLFNRHKDNVEIIIDAVISHRCILKSGYIFRNPVTIMPEDCPEDRNVDWENRNWLIIQEAMLDSLNKYSLIFEYSRDLITVVDAESLNILIISPVVSKLLGYTPEEVIGSNCLEYIHPDQRELLKKELSEKTTGFSGRGVYEIRKKDGAYLWTEGRSNVVRNIVGKDQIIIFTRDIHDKKLAEDALAQREQEFRYQLRYLNTLINNMNELCFTYDNDLMLTFVNRRLIEKLGYSAEEMLGKSLLEFIAPEHRAAAKKEAEMRLQGNFGTHEHRLLCKDGSELLVEIKGSPIYEDDVITGGLVLADDITGRRQMEMDMARLGQMHLVGEMAASIGHEIRNPMTTVQGFLQIMSQNKDFSDHREYFDLMLEELKRANLIISEFLSLAKNKMVNLRPYDLNAILQALAPLLMADSLKEDKNIKFELSKVPDIMLDENEIRQLILNLVRNGLEAMDAGGSVTVKIWHENGKVMLSVQDEGKGIPEEIFDKLGTPFLSTKEYGTGLGLAVCYSIIARHEASMQIESSESGSTFTATFNCA